MVKFIQFHNDNCSMVQRKKVMICIAKIIERARVKVHALLICSRIRSIISHALRFALPKINIVPKVIGNIKLIYYSLFMTK